MYSAFDFRHRLKRHSNDQSLNVICTLNMLNKKVIIGTCLAIQHTADQGIDIRGR